MISRRTALAIAEAYQEVFRKTKRWETVYRRRMSRTVVDDEQLYDYLFEREYDPWFCNAAAKLKDRDPRQLKEFIMRLHTGETQAAATPQWSWDVRQKLGQRYLVNLAEDFLNYANQAHHSDEIQKVKASLELDGYVYKDFRLLTPEADILDVEEERGVLENLYSSLGLRNKTLAFQFLNYSEEHYLTGKWEDSIANSRKFFECVLQEVAAAHSERIKQTELSENIYERPVEVREYLQREGLLEKKEKEVVAKVYGLLSHTGSHPYMAQSEQARLLRHLALTFSQFVMLRLQGASN